jgi:hypothetical protein
MLLLLLLHGECCCCCGLLLLLLLVPIPQVLYWLTQHLGLLLEVAELMGQ